jgi:probable O-glycosylation ligase (exosortase A-associated)
MFSIRDIFVLTALVASIPFCFLRPTYGAACWIVLSFVNPQDYGWGLAQHASPALAVAIPTLLGFAVYSRNLKNLACREVFLMTALWLWFTATTLNSAHDPAFADKAVSAWYRWGLVSKVLLMTVVIIGIIDTWKRFRWLVLTIAGSFGFLALKTLPIMILSGGASRVYGPANSMIADNNDFGLALNMALPFFFFLAKAEQGRRMKWLMGLVFVITIPAIIFTYSRGALVGLVVVLLCMLLQAKQKAVLISFAAMVLVFALLFTPQSWRDRMKTISPDSLDTSALSRLNAWTYAWNMTKDYPIMGGGFDAFTPSLFQRYAPNAADVHGPHSIYFGVMAEHGFTGLFLYLTLVVSCFATLHRIVKQARYYGDAESAHYANILRFSLVGFLVSGAFLGRAYFDFYFSLVACVAILKQQCEAGWAEETEEYEPEPEDMEQPVISYGGPDRSVRNLQDQPAP